MCDCLDAFLQQYGSFFTDTEQKLFRIACETHDLGKIHSIFQEIVTGDLRHRSEYVPHGFFSGLFLSLAELDSEFTREETRALITAVHYHHAREDELTDAEYRESGEKYMKAAYETYTGRPYSTASFRYLRRLLFHNTTSKPLECPPFSVWLKYVLIKGILNKMDYAASAHVPAEQIEVKPKSSLVNTLRNQYGNSLRPAQRFMAEHREENIIVIAPTGSGKTEGALLWLDDKKGFYTLPMKVSANAIFERIHGKDKYAFEMVGLLHSDSAYEYLKRVENKSETTENEEDRLAEYASVKSLAMPLTVSTVDQLFKFVFKALGTEIFAATLKYSRVILDEMQMYSPAIVAMLLCGLKTIADLGGKFAVITATLPPFISRILREEMGISFAEAKFPSDQRRHWVHLQSGDFDFDAIREAGRTKKVLVLCNTVKKAQGVLYELPGARLLHGRFLKKDRAVLENEIQTFADKKSTQPGIWISTQLVEASLDIDFDELHTEMCVVDSLLQRMGRCFRSRNYEGNSPNVFVYDNFLLGNYNKIYDETIYARSVEFLKSYTGRIFTEAEKLEYMRSVYDEAAIRESNYYQTIRKYLNEFSNLPPLKYDRDEADKRFRDIQNRTVIPREIYEDNRAEIDEAVSTLGQKKIPLKERLEARHTLEQYTVSIGLFSKDKDFITRRLADDIDIWLTEAKYDFNPDTHSGGGLLREKLPEDSNFM